MRRFEPVAAVGGVLLLVSLFLPWYGLQGADEIHVSGWQAFNITDVLLALIALPAIAVPIVSVTATGPAKPIAAAVIASATGWLAVLLVGYKLLNPPGPNEFIEARYGVWLALAGALIAWIGSWLTMRDESTPGATAPEIARRPAPPTRAA
jgi:hypothetical protein